MVGPYTGGRMLQQRKERGNVIYTFGRILGGDVVVCNAQTSGKTTFLVLILIFDRPFFPFFLSFLPLLLLMDNVHVPALPVTSPPILFILPFAQLPLPSRTQHSSKVNETTTVIDDVSMDSVIQHVRCSQPSPDSDLLL